MPAGISLSKRVGGHTSFQHATCTNYCSITLLRFGPCFLSLNLYNPSTQCIVHLEPHMYVQVEHM